MVPAIRISQKLQDNMHFNIQRVDIQVHIQFNVWSKEWGNLAPTPSPDWDRPRTARTPETEDAVLEPIENNPGRSTRGVGRELGLYHGTVYRIFQEQGLYPYHITSVQGLLPEDHGRRIQLSEWIVNHHENDPNFI